jgi:hypothetical protein
VAVRAPNLYEALRGFCLGAFSVLARDLERGAELPFAFEQHVSRGRPTLYEYKPLSRSFVESRAHALIEREDARLALLELRHEPAARIFAGDEGDRAFVDRVLMPLLVQVSEACGAFDWDDAAFDRAYSELETSMFGARHTYVALAPVMGVTAATTVELGGGVRLRRAATGELAAHWPEAAGLLPPGFAVEADRLCLLELERTLVAADAEPPDAPGELADAITAIRLATAGAVSAGPVLFERLDWRPFGVRPVVPIAGTEPVGTATRLDAFRGKLAGDLLERLALADDDPELGEALDRWELALFQAEPFRAESLRESLTALLGGADGIWAATMRASLLLGVRVHESDLDPDAVRRALVEALLHGDRPALVETLDEALLGLRPRPVGFYARLAAAGPSGASVAA